jgi:hypothetical protein
MFGGPSWANEPIDERADTTISGVSGSVYVGYSMDGGGDVNGDGFDDLVVGAPWPSGTGDGAGWVMILNGSATGWSSFVSMYDLCKITGKTNLSLREATGFSVAVTGYTDTDGYADLLLGGQYDSTQKGDAWFVAGRSGFSAGSAYTSSGLPDNRYYGSTNGEFVGWSIAAAGDVNGDGYDDFLVGRKDDGNGTDGRAYLYYGPTVPVAGTAQSTARVKFTGAGSDVCPCTVAGVGDIDSDGYDDFAIGTAGNTEKNAGGKVYLFYGKSSTFSSSTSLNAAGMTFYGEAAGDQAGYAISRAGDFNHDGFGDFLIGAPSSDGAATDGGKVYLLTGFAR